MRRHIAKAGNAAIGWKDKPTTKTTCFMMATEFLTPQVE